MASLMLKKVVVSRKELAAFGLRALESCFAINLGSRLSHVELTYASRVYGLKECVSSSAQNG